MATTLIQHRRGTEAEWIAANPILAAGELGYSTDAYKIKVGNGASQWSALPYSTTDISTLATKVSLGSAVSISATKTSLGAAITALTDLANTRATQVSLGNVQSQLTDVIGDAPAAIDTIHELADALKDNEDVLDLYATQVSLGNYATQVSLGNYATQVSLGNYAPVDDPTFTTGITTPKIDIQSNGTIQGKDIVGNNTLRLRTIGGSDLSIEPEGAGIVQVSTDINLAAGKEFLVNGVAIGNHTGLYSLLGHVHTEYADAPLFESKTADFNAGSGRTYFVDTSGGVVTATLPAAPTQGDEARFIDVTGDFAVNNLTVDPGSEKIQGVAANMTNSTARAAFALVYYNAAQGWLLKDK